jgi:triosephosphate isomerase
MHEVDYGAFTGEVSAPMLRSVGCQYVILGHSERRQFFGETDEGINRKIKQAHAHDLVPIVCVGETLEERRAGREKEVVRRQVTKGLEGITIEDPDWLVVAYEPVWAIGTGETATPLQAQEMHALIRSLLKERYGENKGRKVHILYGGSVKPNNAVELFGQQDVNGGLIGGASLSAGDFVEIIQAAR